MAWNVDKMFPWAEQEDTKWEKRMALMDDYEDITVGDVILNKEQVTQLLYQLTEKGIVD